MNEKSIEYDIGSDVACSDGQCGELRRVVVDPVAVAITHLVVEDKHREGVGHLVPIDLVESAEGEIRLRCTTAELRALDDAEEVRFLPGGVGTWGYTQDEMFSLPYYGLAGGGSLGPQPIISDRVPAGEVEVRRGDHVHATDGEIGRVQGLAIDPADHHVTHVLLEEGHLWGKKRVALPITSVSRIDDEVQVGLTKDEIRDLPSIDLDERE
jgi:sporulation protein YlmC with PRC-barrel domain